MDELLLRQMPHSTEAEQAVLGSMLIDAACVKDVMDQLQPDDFYLRQNREIFETIYTMFVYSRPIDGLTVAGELEKAGLANDGTRAYLAQLMEVTPTSANVLEYVRLVREKALLRSVAAAAAEITAMLQEGTGAPGDVLEAAEQKIYAIRRSVVIQRRKQAGVTEGRRPVQRAGYNVCCRAILERQHVLITHAVINKEFRFNLDIRVFLIPEFLNFFKRSFIPVAIPECNGGIRQCGRTSHRRA